MESLQAAFDGFIGRDIDGVEKVLAKNERIAMLGEMISDYLVKISSGTSTLSEEKQINALHSNIGDVARIAELAENITKYTKREVQGSLYFSEGINEKLMQMHALLQKQYLLVKKVVMDEQYVLIEESDALENEIDEMRRELIAEHILRLSQGKCRPENNTIFINLVSNMERVGDHLNFMVHDAVDEK